MAISTKSDNRYTNRVRTRVMGLLEIDNKLLLLRHEGYGEKGYIWLPPGGGVEFGESAEVALIREFKEETNLEIEIENFLFVNEFRDNNLHAYELFFKVKLINGQFKLGYDPEHIDETPILTKIALMSYEKIDAMEKETLHNCFTYCHPSKKIFELNGFFKFE